MSLDQVLKNEIIRLADKQVKAAVLTVHMPVQVIQQRLGHRNIQNTMKYLQVSSA